MGSRMGEPFARGQVPPVMFIVRTLPARPPTSTPVTPLPVVPLSIVVPPAPNPVFDASVKVMVAVGHCESCTWTRLNVWPVLFVRSMFHFEFRVTELSTTFGPPTFPTLTTPAQKKYDAGW